MPALLEAKGVAAGYGGRRVVEGVSFALGEGECLGVIGPNGSGKSTLLKALAGVVPLAAGEVVLDSTPLAFYSRKHAARKLAGVPAELNPGFSFRAGDVVAMGRNPWLPLLADLGPRDEEAIARAMAATGTAGLRERWFDELSSGERQRVALAQALAQEPKVLLLDEPTAHLDLRHAVELLDLLRELRRARGLATVLVSHDLNAAAEYADRILLLDCGRPRALGPPGDVFDYRLLEEVYRVVLVVDENPISGRPRVVPASAWSLERARALPGAGGSAIVSAVPGPVEGTR